VRVPEPADRAQARRLAPGRLRVGDRRPLKPRQLDAPGEDVYATSGACAVAAGRRGGSGPWNLIAAVRGAWVGLGRRRRARGSWAVPTRSGATSTGAARRRAGVHFQPAFCLDFGGSSPIRGGGPVLACERNARGV
jgi:hypothetical protein